MGYEHLVSEVGQNHVAVVGRHDLGSAHPDVPAHLIEITRIDLGSEWGSETSIRGRSTRAGSESEPEAQSMAVSQFLAD